MLVLIGSELRVLMGSELRVLMPSTCDAIHHLSHRADACHNNLMLSQRGNPANDSSAAMAYRLFGMGTGNPKDNSLWKPFSQRRASASASVDALANEDSSLACRCLVAIWGLHDIAPLIPRPGAQKYAATRAFSARYRASSTLFPARSPRRPVPVVCQDRIRVGHPAQEAEGGGE